MEDSATNVARAIVATLDWASTPDARSAAFSYLESVLSLSLCLVFFFFFLCKTFGHFEFSIEFESLKFDCLLWKKLFLLLSFGSNNVKF